MSSRGQARPWAPAAAGSDVVERLDLLGGFVRERHVIPRAVAGVLPDAEAAQALAAHHLVPAGAEGLAALALADALKERAQQALGLGVQVQAVGDGGVALGPAKHLDGQPCHGAGRQLGTALVAGTLHAGDLKGVIPLRQQDELLLFVGKFVIPAECAAFRVHVIHK